MREDGLSTSRTGVLLKLSSWQPGSCKIHACVHLSGSRSCKY